MPSNKVVKNLISTEGLTEELCAFLNETRETLHGAERRIFMAKVVTLIGYGGKYKAERYLGWNRSTINKGIKELKSGLICVDNYASRGRKRSEAQLPKLLKDIHDIVTPLCQNDPTFRGSNIYLPITASEVRRRLISEKGYDNTMLPTTRTILNKLNKLGFTLKKGHERQTKKRSGQGSLG